MIIESASRPQIPYYPMLIGGALLPGAGALPVLNPATEAVIGHAARASAEELDAAIAAARRAFPAWKSTPLAERQATLARCGAIFRDNAGALAALLTSEQGKPLAEARTEIESTIWLLGAFAEMNVPSKVLEDSDDRRVEQHQVPLGIVAAIAPWNFPVTLALWKVAPALLTGNCVVVKPSPYTPLTTLRIGELLRDAVPAGVLNIVSGGDELGPMLTAHPGIDKIAFTGSTATGRRVLQSAAPTIKRVTLELGGNDAAIVLPDADLERTVPALFWAALRNSGQICIAAKRIYVHADIYDRFRDAFADLARSARMGDGAAPETQLGPVQNRAQYETVTRLIEDCRNRGLVFAAGGQGRVGDSGPGYFIPATVIDNPPDDAPIVTEEPFGPVVPLLRYDRIEDAIERANGSDYGLAGSVWSRDLAAARSVAEQLECGTVWINEAQYLTPWQPFGGHKQSGLGVESGAEGLAAYTNTQVVTLRREPAPV